MPQIAYKKNRERSKALGKHLKELRKSRNLTQIEASKLSGLDQAYWAKVEAAYIPYSPSLNWLRRASKGLGLSQLEEAKLISVAGRIDEELEKSVLIAQERPELQTLLKLAVGLSLGQVNQLISTILHYE